MRHRHRHVSRNRSGQLVTNQSCQYLPRIWAQSCGQSHSDSEWILCLFCRMGAQSQISVDLGKIKKCDISCTAVCELKFIPTTDRKVSTMDGIPPPFIDTVMVLKEDKLRYSSCLTNWYLNKFKQISGVVSKSYLWEQLSYFYLFGNVI